MQKTIGFGVGAFVWIVFDNLALALIFGLLAGAGAGARAGVGTGKAVRPPPSPNDGDAPGSA